MNKVSPFLKLMRFDRPIGIYLLLWPTLWALWIAAQGFPGWKLLSIFVVGVVVMRAAGCVMNDLADRKFDPHVERTKTRPLANGTISVKSALILMFVLMLIALGLVLMLNSLCLIIALVSVLLTFAYPFFKRFFVTPQLILGMIFNGILIAFAAVQNNLPPSAWILYAAAICWTIAYDTMYAKTDQDDDAKLGLKSSSIFFGHSVNLMITIFQSLFFTGLIIVGILNQLHFMYWLGIVAAVGFAIYQQKLIRSNVRENNFKAFLNNHWLGMVVFLGVLLSY